LTITERMLKFLIAILLSLRWYCNGCWQAWEEDRKEKRLNSGKLLPEDRVVWYSSTFSDRKAFECDDGDYFQLSLNEQLHADSDWIKVDTYSLVLETYPDDQKGGLYISCPSDPTRISRTGEATIFKSLSHRIYTDDEFVIDFRNTRIQLTQASIVPLKQIVPFPGKIVGSTFERFRSLARESRKMKFLKDEEDRRKAAEQKELRKKQMIENQQKQKDLVQLALKRAQNKKVTTTTAVVSGTPPMHASPVPSLPLPMNTDPWSANGNWSSLPPPPMMMGNFGRPMIPPPMPPHMQWAAGPIPVLDPWSSAAFQHAPVSNPWARPVPVAPAPPTASSEEPDPKRARTPPDVGTSGVGSCDDAMKQRMARFGPVSR